MARERPLLTDECKWLHKTAVNPVGQWRTSLLPSEHRDSVRAEYASAFAGYSSAYLAHRRPLGRLHFCLPRLGTLTALSKAEGQLADDLLRCVSLSAHQLASLLCPDSPNSNIQPGLVFRGWVTSS
jgi:hypothetical protein